MIHYWQTTSSLQKHTLLFPYNLVTFNLLVKTLVGIDGNVFLVVFVQQQLVIYVSQVKGSEAFASSQGYENVLGLGQGVLVYVQDGIHCDLVVSAQTNSAISLGYSHNRGGPLAIVVIPEVPYSYVISAGKI